MDEHQRRSDQIIDEIQDEVKKINGRLTTINDALIGTLDNPANGFIPKITERLNKLEDKQAVQWWLIAMIMVIVVTGSFKIFFA